MRSGCSWIRGGKQFAIAGLSAAALAVGAAPAQAETIYAITPGNVLVRFDSASPQNLTSFGAVSGLNPGQSIRGIDFRPSTGQLFAVSVVTASANNSPVQTYTLNKATGQATFVGQTAAAVPGAGDFATGTDFNPRAPEAVAPFNNDRIRYVTSSVNDENARLDPNDGTLEGNDTDLTPAAATDVIAEAYDRPAFPAAQTTLYAINRFSNRVSIQGGINGTPSPNGGVQTDLAPLGFTLNGSNDGGFDISTSNVGFAALTNAADNLTRFYRIAIPTVVSNDPAASSIGLIGNGMTEVRSIAIDVDVDSDGDVNGSDNCPSVANPDQADLDGDGAGDACDPDQDGDGLSDSLEAAIGSDPRSTDTDGDAVGDGGDACPTIPAGTAGQANGCPDITLPETEITDGPKKKTRSRKASIEFSSTEPGSTFACSLDNAAFKPCDSPQEYKKLKRRGHGFDVRAIDPAGNLDPTPDELEWRVKRRKKGGGGN